MFKFKGISSTDMQVIVEEEEHFIARAAKRYEMTEIEGRDGAIFNELGYSIVERPIYVQCLNIDKIDDILAWLDGEGEFEYKGRKTIARFYSELEPKRTACIRIIDTTFIRDPFWTKANEEYTMVKNSKLRQVEDKNISIKDSSDLPLKNFNVVGNTEQNTENAIPYKKAEGTYLHLTNITHKDTKNFNIIGNIEQKTREGYNLFNIEELNYITSNTHEVTKINKDECKYKVINATGDWWNVPNYKILNILSNTTYRLEFEVTDINIATGKYSRILLDQLDSTGNVISVSGTNMYKDVTEKGKYNIIVTTTSNTVSFLVRIYTEYGTLNANKYITLKNIQLTEGSEEKTYEKYGAMPSLDYPSEVRACGDNVNLFDYRTTIVNKVLNNNNELEDNDNYCTSDYMEIKPNKQYCFTKHEKVSHIPTSTDFFILLYDENKTYVARFAIENGGSIEIIPTAKYMRVSYHCTSEYDSTLDPKVKIEEGSKATPYSPYGEGNISIKKSNKNLAKINESYFKLTENNRIKNTKRIDNVKAIENIKIKKGQVVKCRMKLFSKPTKSTTFTAYKSIGENSLGVQLSEITFGNVQNYSLNTNYDKTWTATEDCIIYYYSWGNEGAEIFEFEFSISLNNFIEYTPHEGKTYTIPVQAPFYEGDKFIIKDGKRYEEHNKVKVILDENKNITYYDAPSKALADSYSTAYFSVTYLPKGNQNKFICNVFKESYISAGKIWGSGYDTDLEEGLFVNTDSSIRIRINKNRLTGYSNDLTSTEKVNLFKEYLKKNNIEIVYPLATPTLIPCTEEQNDILDEIEEDELYLETTYIYSTDKIEPKISIEYDGYDGTPSTKYPSEVRACGDNINIFNKENANIIDKVYFDSATTIKYDGYSKILYMACRPNQAYTVQRNIKTKRLNVGTTSVLPAQGVTINKEITGAWDNNTPISIVTDSNAKYLIVYFIHYSDDYATEQEILNNIKIEENEKATPWSPYEKGNISIEKYNANLLNLTANTEGTKNGINYKIEGTKITLTGTSTALTDIYFYGYWGYEEENKRHFINKGKYVFSANDIKIAKEIVVNIYQGMKHIVSLNYEEHKIIELTNDTYFSVFYISIPKGKSFNNSILKLQLEPGENKTNYTPHEGKTYTIPTQAPFYEGDKFIIKDGKRYEEHNWSEIIITGNEGWLYVENSQCWYVQNFFTNKLDYSEILSTHYFCMNAFATSTMLDRHMGSGSEASEYSNRNRLYIKDIDNAPTNIEEFENWIKNLKIKVYYKLATPTLIPCIEEQNTILDEIEEDGTYKNVTYYYSNDEVEPTMNIEYISKTDEKINNAGNIESRPILRLEKTIFDEVEITINKCRFKYIFNNDSYVDIDCEEKIARYEGLNRNRSIEIDYDFPILNIGKNDIIMHKGDCTIKVLRKDRWL